ncbi:MAG: serine hydrolase [Gammaproteobacteria bacterium]|nr:serine hydrolase [Gammaproteobacteria bacterium]
MSEDRLKRVADHMDAYVEDGKLPCAVCLVNRRGRETFFYSVGKSDVENDRDVQRDTVFRIYSMSKPVTSVALMMLYELGKFQLDDPVSKYVPSWKNLRVYESGEGDKIKTRPTKKPMTIKHLLTHTAGLTYGFMDNHPVDALYRQRGVEGGGSRTLESMIEHLSEIPLLYDPGSLWRYSFATDVCGYLVQRFGDCDLDEFVKREISSPLGLEDTDFHVRKESADRLAACYQHTRDGFDLQDASKDSRYLQRPTFLSGGGGMVSTVDEYQRFAQMLLNKGEFHGVRILGRKTVEYMSSNHLPGNADLSAMGQPVFSETSFEGIGFGLGFSVVIDPAAASVLDSPGEYAWGGAASTYFWIDPIEQLSVVFMTQLLPSSTWPIRRELKTLVYQSFVD